MLRPHNQLTYFYGTISAAICLLLISCATAENRDIEKATYHLQIGSAALMQGNNPTAISELAIAAELDPDNALIHNNLGLAYFLREKYDLAETSIRKALDLKSDYSDARNNLGRLLLEKGNTKEAIKEFNLVIQDLKYQFPERPLINIGITYFRMEDYATAKKYLLQAIEYQRENCLAQSYLGRVFHEQKQYKQATGQLDKAVAFCKKSQFDEPLYYSALSYFQMGEKQKSEARLEEIIRMYPQGKYVDKARSTLELMKR